MTASVDAVGPSGWISALPAVDINGDSDSAIAAASREMELIADMKSEISAALAGVEEATYLKGILREYLRFADQVATPAATAGDAVAKIDDETPASSNLVRYEKLNGADLVVFGRPGEGEDGYDGDAGGKMLPLSLKPATADVSRTKINKSTGESKSRTSREIGYLRRKAVGKYSFERLLV
jgi:nucleotide-binding universal stress UspA family protein